MKKIREKKYLIFIALGSVAIVLLILGAQDYLKLNRAKTELSQAKIIVDSIMNNPQSFSSSKASVLTEHKLFKAEKLSYLAETDLSNSLSLKITSYIPYVSSQLSAIRSLVKAAHETLIIVSHLLFQINQLGLNVNFQHDQLPLSQLIIMNNDLKVSQSELKTIKLPTAGHIEIVQKQINKFNQLFSHLITLINNAEASLNTFLKFTTGNHAKQYLIVGLNNDEMRDQGAPLSFAVLTIEPNGAFSISQPQDIGALSVSQPVNISLPYGTQRVFGELQPTLYWQSTNADANFSLSGKLMLALYQEKTGQNLNGVIALDVKTLQKLINIVGPVSLPGTNIELTNTNVAAVLLYQLYQQTPFNKQSIRYDEIAAIAKAVIAKLTSDPKISLVSLSRTIYNLGQERHLIIYSANQHIENYLENKGLSGNVNTYLANRTFHVAVENATATKMDYYISVAATYNVVVTSSGSAVITCKLTVTDNAPLNASPSYILGPDYINSFSPGEYVGRAEFYGPAGSEQLSSITESGLQLNEIPFKIYPQQSIVLTQQTVLPYGVKNHQLTLRFVPQPRFNPIQLNVNILSPSLKLLTNNNHFSQSWNRPIILKYRFAS